MERFISEIRNLISLSPARLCLRAPAPNFLIMEYQYAVNPVYLSIMKGEHPRFVDGSCARLDSPGIGIKIINKIIRALH